MRELSNVVAENKVQERSWKKVYFVRLVLIAGIMQTDQIIMVSLVTRILGTSINGLFKTTLVTLWPLLVPVLLSAFFLYWVSIRFLEQRSVHELRPSGAFQQFTLGLGAAVLLFAIVFSAITSTGNFSYQGYAGLGSIPSSLLLYATGAVFEELIFRGALFRITEEACGTGPALIISASCFGVSHLANPGATLFSVVSIAVGSTILCLAYSLTKSLWCSIGIHLGWNLAQGALFGATVSGHASQGIFRFMLAGPDWLTGGAFGPEASVFSIILFGALAGVLSWLTIRSRNWSKAKLRIAAPGLTRARVTSN
jgi:membrane protease YdiL (CAAX protease family)